MPVSSSYSRLLLLLGDLALFYVALFLALLARYTTHFTKDIIKDHLVPFSILFIIWIIVFLIGGMYEKHVRVLKNRLPGTILRVQIANSIVAVIFFYAVPYFGIAPKTTLFIYLVISFGLITLWRMYGPLLFGHGAQGALLIGSGTELHELSNELSRNVGYPVIPRTTIDLNAVTDSLEKDIYHAMSGGETSVIVADITDTRLEKVLPRIYGLVEKGYAYIELHRLYEDVFKRLPVSLLTERWLIENISLLPRKAYDSFRRLVDIVLGLVVLIVTSPLFLLAYILIKADDQGPTFFIHDRVGQDGKAVKIMKFRSMAVHNEKDGLAKEKKLTRVGAFLRKSRIDELPQLWNVIRGDLSLIGPRPELPTLVAVYEKQIPYYNLRHVVKPGLSGWAQINQRTPPKFVAEVDATKQKVAYDLFYIKHRSIILDTLIALQTIRELLSRRGI